MYMSSCGVFPFASFSENADICTVYSVLGTDLDKKESFTVIFTTSFSCLLCCTSKAFIIFPLLADVVTPPAPKF